MSLNRGMNKEDVEYIYIILFSRKENEIMSFAVTWRGLAIVIQR